ncbi:MAG: threonine ammonia-lyase [Inquilinus sp.]|nr:threonine ammonia-lyase [Inquilinus sp.]
MSAPGLPLTIDAVREAVATLAGAIVDTPTISATALSGRLGCEVYLKLENLQFTGSFKDRGALVKLTTLDEAARRRGVIAMSAGNHAQGVAHHASRLGIPATIVMPSNTPFTKVVRTEELGATVVQQGENLDDCRDFVDEQVATRGLTLIHPYDDPAIMAGQGTIGLEMLAAVPQLDDLIVPIGGGGLISGIAVAAKALRPEIRITGVEAALYPSMSDAIAGVDRSYGGATIAEGIAVKRPGMLTRKVVAALVDEILLIEEAVLERAVQTLLTEQKLLAEGAGAAGIAALMAAPDRFAGRRVGVVICGGNIDARLLSSVLLRGLIREGRLVRLRVEIVDAPGTLAKISGLVGGRGANIVEVHHRRLFYELPVKRAEIDLIVETRDRRHVEAVTEALTAGGFPARILSEVDG